MDKSINRRVPSNRQQTTQFVASHPVNHPIRKPETVPGSILPGPSRTPAPRVFPNTESVEQMPSRSDFNPGILFNNTVFHNTPNNPPYREFLSPSLSDSEFMDLVNDTLTPETSLGKLLSTLQVSPFGYAFYVPVKR
jgi:hypothetical protein